MVLSNSPSPQIIPTASREGQPFQSPPFKQGPRQPRYPGVFHLGHLESRNGGDREDPLSRHPSLGQVEVWLRSPSLLTCPINRGSERREPLKTSPSGSSKESVGGAGSWGGLKPTSPSVEAMTADENKRYWPRRGLCVPPSAPASRRTEMTAESSPSLSPPPAPAPS